MVRPGWSYFRPGKTQIPK